MENQAFLDRLAKAEATCAQLSALGATIEWMSLDPHGGAFVSIQPPSIALAARLMDGASARTVVDPWGRDTVRYRVAFCGVIVVWVARVEIERAEREASNG